MSACYGESGSPLMHQVSSYILILYFQFCFLKDLSWSLNQVWFFFTNIHPRCPKGFQLMGMVSRGENCNDNYTVFSNVPREFKLRSFLVFNSDYLEYRWISLLFQISLSDFHDWIVSKAGAVFFHDVSARLILFSIVYGKKRTKIFCCQWYLVCKQAFLCCVSPMKTTFPQMFADFAKTDQTY